LLRAVLVKLLIERQLVVDKGLVDYAVLRLDRSLDAARTFVDLLDRQALSRQSRVTRALAAEVLRSILPDEGFEPGDEV
jgi:chromosomal replication initiation ATPase DnaA